MTLRRALPCLRSLAAAAVFLGSAVLPVLHEWSVGTAEAAFHALVAEPGRPTLLPSGSAHKHHTDGACVLCPLLLRAAAADSPSAGRAAGLGTGTLLRGLVSAPLSPSVPLLPPSRAPPAA